jgi:S1-C subfamily serine protease
LRRLDRIVSPSRVLQALARVDPFPTLAGPLAPVARPDPRLLADPSVRRAAPSVVRIVGSACGLGVEGSGWVARRGLVVTAAHVVAGQSDTVVQAGGRQARAEAVVFDPHNDLAVLRVEGLRAPPLHTGEAREGAAVVILGYPNDGPLTAAPARIGRTALVFTQDAYGHGPVAREITSLRGRVRHGDSGGPAVDSSGAVQVTVFASRVGGGAGFAVPSQLVQRDLKKARGPVSTGNCPS